MERWAGRIAVVTGASAGIGAAIATELVKHGLRVVGIARRVERIEETSKSLEDQPGRLYAVQADITNENEVKEAFNWIKSNLGGVDILVNNAGVNVSNSLMEGPVDAWRRMFELNVFAGSNCSREALQIMKDNGVNDGHIVNINSLLGHVIPPAEFSLFMYTASKHAVTVLTEGLRRELVSKKSRIKVTSISPGLVRTEFTTVSTKDITPEALLAHPHLRAQDLADAVLYALGTPETVQVHEITLRPTGQIG